MYKGLYIYIYIFIYRERERDRDREREITHIYIYIYIKIYETFDIFLTSVIAECFLCVVGGGLRSYVISG